jgi:hypothetical protein
MKIVQDEWGKVSIRLGVDETYDIKEHLEALMDFVCKQAIEVYRLTNSHRKIVGRLDELESKFSKTTNKQLKAN